jgi:hypothetical protein
MGQNRKRTPRHSLGRAFGGKSRVALPSKLHVDLLGNRQSIIYLDAEIANGALNLGVSKQQLYRPQIAGTTINEGGLGPPPYCSKDFLPTFWRPL